MWGGLGPCGRDKVLLYNELWVGLQAWRAGDKAAGAHHTWLVMTADGCMEYEWAGPRACVSGLLMYLRVHLSTCTVARRPRKPFGYHKVLQIHVATN